MDELQQAVERGQRCRASLLESRVVTVRYSDGSEPVSRFIRTFALHERPTAKRAFAWQRGENPHPDEAEYSIVLNAAGINSAEDALESTLREVFRSL
jgi:hypothetical protein